MNADRASATARLIAAATVMREGSRQHGGAGPSGAAEWCQRFLSTNRADRLLLWTARSALGQAWWRFAELATIPGIVSHWMRRKREIDRLARQAAADGFKQLIVLGAGLDALAFRLNKERLYDRILSADHAATLAVIHAATDSFDATAPRLTGASTLHGVELLSLDFARDDVCRTLAASRTFDAGRAALVVIEGVLMYLSASTVERLLRALALLPTPSVRLIASSMVAEPGQSAGFRGQTRLVRNWLSRRNEPMLWASTRSALAALLAECGWCEARLIDLSEEEPGGGKMACGLSSELLVVAERRTAS